MANLAAHKSPAWSILQIGGTEFLTRSLLSVLGAGQDGSPVRYSTYTVAHPDAEWIDEAEKWLPEVKSGVTLKLFKTDLPSEAFNSDSYDLVIVGDAPPGIDHKQSVMSMAHAALKEGGTALLAGSNYSSDTL